MIGVATNDIISMKGDHYAGQFMYGWVFSSAGYKYNFGKYSLIKNQNNNLDNPGHLKWCTNDKITIIFHDYAMKLCMNGCVVSEWKLNKYLVQSSQVLIPAICINGRNGSKCEFLGITQQ